MAAIAIEECSKVYEGDVLAVDAVDLEVADGELLVLVGPSGCGKSTLLRMVAGLEEVTAGRVTIGERDVTYLQPKDRDIAMVFQSYALYPHMSVRRNIGYPLKVARVPKAERDKRVAEIAALLQLEPELDRRPSQLSGGQRQRVAMGRALIRQPQAFLMDEPLSNLDAKLRVEMRAEIARLQRELQVTSLYVTHDQVEAMTMGHRVAVLNAGRLQQLDTPQRVYDRPANLFVATFIGSPPMNVLTATVQWPKRASDGGPQWAIELGNQALSLDAALAAAFPGLAAREGRPVVVGLRPEALGDAALEPDLPVDRVIEATVDLVEPLGAEIMAHVSIPGRPDDRMVARLGTRNRPHAGDVIKLAVDPAGLHLFDPDTGEALRDPSAPGDPTSR